MISNRRKVCKHKKRTNTIAHGLVERSSSRHPPWARHLARAQYSPYAVSARRARPSRRCASSLGPAHIAPGIARDPRSSNCSGRQASGLTISAARHDQERSRRRCFAWAEICDRRSTTLAGRSRSVAPRLESGQANGFSDRADLCRYRASPHAAVAVGRVPCVHARRSCGCRYAFRAT